MGPHIGCTPNCKPSCPTGETPPGGGKKPLPLGMGVTYINDLDLASQVSDGILCGPVGPHNLPQLS